LSLITIDPSFLDWGDIGGVCYAHKTHNLSFNLSVALKMSSAKEPEAPEPTPKPRQTKKRKSKKLGFSGADKD
jgi:hypothetical protein